MADDDDEGEVVPFARTPGDLQKGQPINIGSKSGRYIYEESQKSLYSSPEEYFDLKADGLTLFLNKLDQRARQFQWHNDVLLIENNLNNLGVGGPGRYFLENHGKYSLAHVQAVERHYNAQESRTSQNSYLLSQTILNSLTPLAQNRVNASGRKKEWILDIEKDGEEQDMECGVCLLKVVLIISQQETRSTLSHVMEQLNDLSPLMEEADYNIEAFHVKVNELLDKILKADKDIPENLLMSLFSVYKTVPDQEFVRFIKDKQGKYEDEGVDLNHYTLMHAAEQKYHNLVNIEKSWRALSEESKQIAALTATVTNLQKRLKQQKPKTGKADEKRQTAASGRQKKPDWLWNQIKPRNLNETRFWNGKEYRWCSSETGGQCNPGKWVCHTKAECVGPAFRAKRNPPSEKPKGDGKGRPPKKQKKGQKPKAYPTQIATEAAPELQAALAKARKNVVQNDDEDDES